MSQLDVLYRALLEYRKNTLADRESSRQREEIVKSNKADRIEITKTRCVIDEDWIAEIEKGLVFVEKAIKEERQFIRSNGEIVPIEKAKRVSKDSVEHLARHSNLLTKEPVGEDIIPDQIYTVERLSDYAVYENRFLYMLLCYLRDFITIRYDKILELTNTYKGKLVVEKSVVARKRRLKYTTVLEEEKKDDEWCKAHNEAKETIDRIDLILKTVMLFLSTPLMDEVGKAPMLKPPITKTNVLKMNNNFRNAVALYDFVTSYHKKGYKIEREVKEISPLPQDGADEMAEVITLASFLTYEYGLGLKESLRLAYDEEEVRRKEQRDKEHIELIKKLKKRIVENGDSPEEYMLALERRNRELEDDSAQLRVARAEIAQLKEEIIALKEEREELNATIRALNGQIETLIAEHTEKINALALECEGIVKELVAKQEEEKTAIHAENKRATENLIARYNEEIDGVIGAYEQKLEAEQQKCTAQIAMIEQKMQELIAKNAAELKQEKARYAEKIKQKASEFVKERKKVELERDEAKKARDTMRSAKEMAEREKRLTEARLNALRLEYGLITSPEEFTNKASFDEIEHQYKVFKKFFKEQWKETKRRIRRDILSGEGAVESSSAAPSPDAMGGSMFVPGVERNGLPNARLDDEDKKDDESDK